MISSEVQRTLVKSPPELWAEISDPTSLARHLGEFGEIRITRVEPEQRVEWEGGDTSGSVVIKPSGWGTRVKLTVTRELPEPAADEAEDVADVDVCADEPKFENLADVDAEDPESEHVAQLDAGDQVAPSDSEPEEPEEPEAGESDRAPQGEAEQQAAPERRRGFFARLFGRRRAAHGEQPTVDPEPSEHVAPDGRAHGRYNAMTVWAAQVGPDTDEDFEATQGVDAEDELVAAEARAGDSPSAADCQSRDDGKADGESSVDISAEIKAAEEVAAEQVTAVLTGVLDRLGAAHHRPFSRA